MEDIHSSTSLHDLRADFFTTRVGGLGGAITYYTLFTIHLRTRRVQVLGTTRHPNRAFMSFAARKLEIEERRTSSPTFLIHDRDKKFGRGFDSSLRQRG